MMSHTFVVAMNSKNMMKNLSNLRNKCKRYTHTRTQNYIHICTFTVQILEGEKETVCKKIPTTKTAKE